MGADRLSVRAGITTYWPLKRLAGSLIGGVKETQEMLDSCFRKKIYCDIELVPAAKINEVYERTVKGDVKYRFVIDAATF